MTIVNRSQRVIEHSDGPAFHTRARTKKNFDVAQSLEIEKLKYNKKELKNFLREDDLKSLLDVSVVTLLTQVASSYALSLTPQSTSKTIKIAADLFPMLAGILSGIILSPQFRLGFMAGAVQIYLPLLVSLFVPKDIQKDTASPYAESIALMSASNLALAHPFFEEMMRSVIQDVLKLSTRKTASYFMTPEKADFLSKTVGIIGAGRDMIGSCV